MSPPATLTGSSFFIPLFLFFFCYFSGHRRCLPSSYPIIGNLIPLLLNRHRFHDWAADLLAGAPTSTILVHTPFFSTPGVCTAHLAAVDHLLLFNFPSYVKGARFRSHLSDLLGAGIFAADCRLWSRQRKAADHEFSSRSPPRRGRSPPPPRPPLRRRRRPHPPTAASSTSTTSSAASPSTTSAESRLGRTRRRSSGTSTAPPRSASAGSCPRSRGCGSKRRLRQAVVNITNTP